GGGPLLSGLDIHTSRYRRASGAPASAASGVHRVIGRNLEQGRWRAGPIDVLQRKGGFSGPGVAVLGHDGHLQVGRIPLLVDDVDGTVIADVACGNRNSGPGSVGLDAFEVHVPQLLDLRILIARPGGDSAGGDKGKLLR